jgi:hypothetical protein
LADDTTIKGFEKAGKAMGEHTKTTADLTKATEAQTAAMQPNIRALENFANTTAEAARQQETLGESISRQNRQLIDQARQVGSLQSQYASLTGGLSGFIGNMGRMISLGNVYTQLLDEMRTGQKAFTASLSASTKELGSATENADKVLWAYRNTMADARNIAARLGIDYEELKGISGSLVNQFTSQLIATGRTTEATMELQKNVVHLSRFMGTDYAETIGMVDNRLQGSTKTLGEVQDELIAVAREADKWTGALQNMGDRAMKTGNVTRKQFWEVLKGIKQEFQGGMYAAEGFAKSTRLLMTAAKESGLTPEESKAMAGGFGRIIKQMGSFNSIFGAKTAQYFGSLLSDLSQIQDDALRKRFEPYAKRFMETGQLNVLDLRALVSTSQGSAEGIHHLSRIIRESGVSRDVIRSIFAETLGPHQQHLADKITDFVRSGQSEKAFKAISTSDKKSQKTRKDQLDVFKAKFDDLIKAGHSTASVQHSIAKKAYELQQEIYGWLQRSPLLMAAAIMGAKALGGLLGMAGRGIATRLGTRLAMGGGRFAGVGSRMAAWGRGPMMMHPTGAMPAPLTAAPGAVAGATGTSFLGTSVTGGALLGGGAKGLAMGAGALTAAAVGGIAAGRYIDKNLGPILVDSTSRAFQAAVGKDRTISGAISTYMALPREMIEQMVRIRGVFTKQQGRAIRQREQMIKNGRANWGKLSSSQKDIIRGLERQQEQAKRWQNKMTLNNKERLQYDKEFKAAQVKDMTRAVEKGMAWEKIMGMEGPARGREAVAQFVTQAGGRLKRGTGAALTSFLKTPQGQKLLQMSGMSAEQFRGAAIKQVARQKFFEGEDPMKATGKMQAYYLGELQKWTRGAEGKAASPEMMSEALDYIRKLKEADVQRRMGGLDIRVQGEGGEPEQSTVGFDSADNMTVSGKTKIKMNVRSLARQVNEINNRGKPRPATG